MHEGEALKNFLKSSGKKMTYFISKLDMSKQNFYHHLRKTQIDDDFKRLIEDKLSIDFTKVKQAGAIHTTGEAIRKQKAFGEKGDEGIIHVPIAAQAGYAQHYEDPIYIQDLDRIYLPNIKFKGDNFRSFEVEGDSMEPTLKEGVQVICQKVEQEDWKQLMEHYIHVFVTRTQILIKRPIKIDDESIALASDNEDLYPQFVMYLRDLKEIWRVRRKIDYDMAPPRRIELKIKK